MRSSVLVWSWRPRCSFWMNSLRDGLPRLWVSGGLGRPVSSRRARSAVSWPRSGRSWIGCWHSGSSWIKISTIGSSPRLESNSEDPGDWREATQRPLWQNLASDPLNSDGKPASPDSFTVNHDNGPRQFCVGNRHQDAPHTFLALGFTVVPAAQKDHPRSSRTQLGQKPRAVQVCRDRSEERRVGKECRSRWSPYH